MSDGTVEIIIKQAVKWVGKHNGQDRYEAGEIIEAKLNGRYFEVASLQMHSWGRIELTTLQRSTLSWAGPVRFRSEMDPPLKNRKRFTSQTTTIELGAQV